MTTGNGPRFRWLPTLVLVVATAVAGGALLGDAAAERQGRRHERGESAPPASQPGTAVSPVSGDPCRQPRGIYALDSYRGVHRDAAIRSYPFVTGYAWRAAWSEFEREEGQYDFSGLDHIIGKLDLLGKKLTLLRGRGGPQGPEPEYLAKAQDAATYTFKDAKRGLAVKRVVPWDPGVMERFRAFVKALGDHRVPSRAAGGAPTPLRDHPVLANLNLAIPGLGPIRERQEVELTRMPAYRRDNFIVAVKDALRAVTAEFPNKVVFVGFWRVTDNERSPELWEAIRTTLLAEFDGKKNPRIGFFQENLAASRDAAGALRGTPTTEYAAPLYASRGSAHIMFQALQGWSRPFRTAEKTARAGPGDGMAYAYETFGATYFELYVADLDNKSYWPGFNEWHQKLVRAPGCGQ